MSGVGLRAFIDVAQRKPGDAEIRFAKGTEAPINKGTAGNRVASWFQSLGEWMGLRRPDPTRAARQEGALRSF